MPTDISVMYPEFTNLIIQTYFFYMYDIQTQPDWQRFTQIVPSTKPYEIYPTMTAVPTMQNWDGRRRFERAGTKQSYMVYNGTYDSGITFPLNVFHDDNYGILQHQMSQLAMEGKRKPMALAFDVLNNGAVSSTSDANYAVGIDGLPLFSASHPGKVDITSTDTQSNTNGSGTSTSLTIDNLNSACTAMKKFYDNQGKPLYMMPDTLIVPPDLSMVARQILHSTYLMSVGTNASQNATSVGTGTNGSGAIGNLPTFNVFNVEGGGDIKTIVESPYISSTTAWYIACCSNRVAKPVLLQEREAPELTIKMDRNTSDLVFQTNDVYCSIIARWGAAPGDWHTVFKGNS